MPTFTKNAKENVSAAKGVAGGYAFVAPLGSKLPTDYSTKLDAAYKVLGYVSEDGYVVSEDEDGTEITDLSGEVIDTVGGKRVESAQLTLAEIKADTLKMMYGSANVTDNAGVITVKHNGDRHDMRVLVLDLVLKNSRRWRHVVPCAQTADLDSLTIAATELATRALTVKYLADDDGNTAYDYIQSTETAS